MKRELIIRIATLTAIMVLIAGGALADKTSGNEYGVYEYVIQMAEGSVSEIANAIETAAADGGWRVLANVEASAPGDCGFRARVIVLFDESYATDIMNVNSVTGPYAVLDRINVFEDENGTHVSVVNPHSITRTVLMDDTIFEEPAETHLQALRTMIIAVVQGTESAAQYGQIRSEGYIGKTMGVVAGGKFGDLIEVKAGMKHSDLDAAAAQVRKGLERKSKMWGMKAIFEVEMPEYGVVLFGSTGSPMDSKSFDIVKAGADEARKDFACPGLAHAAAYPIEVVVAKDGDKIEVSVIEATFRMKMYFEDAGKWAFMNNMKMPGSIDKELRKQVKAGIERS